MPSRLATSLALALLSSLAACDDSTGIVAADIACPTPQTLTYANYGQAVIAAECLDCHTTKERPFLDTQARVVEDTRVLARQAPGLEERRPVDQRAQGRHVRRLQRVDTRQSRRLGPVRGPVQP